MEGFREFVKKEIVVIIAGAAALISCAFVPVVNYIDYVDTEVIGTLFSLMAIIAGLKGNNVLSRFSGWIVEKAHINGTRRALVVISLLTFFLSMLVTNDAALIALVPVTVLFFADYPSQMIYAIVVQTVAANMGSMATPFGNPQNLLIYSSYSITPAEFFAASLPTTAVSLAAVLILCVLIKNKPLVPAENDTAETTGSKAYIFLYGVLFVLVMVCVFTDMSILVAFASVCAVVMIIEPQRLFEVDYGLLITFVFFFIFVENIQRIDVVNSFITELVQGREFFASAAISQVISNVPAAVMLSGFTDNWKAVMLGTDIGGLGTPVASLASLISMRIYGETENAKTGRFLGVFTVVNFVLLVLIYAFAELTQI
ncbi:MAG: citrate transporter [Oscillospiraceae bacterium]|nr:citrate transporter [Oscillospiraceae bacterium]